MNDIDSLLDKYFNGISTVEEERILKSYFEGNGVSSEHEIYRPIFAVFNAEKRIKAPKIILPQKKNNRVISLRRTFIFLAGAVAVALLAVLLTNIHSTQEIDSEYVVIMNGKKITNKQIAREYAESMFGEAKKIKEDSFQSFREATMIKEELNAEKLFREAAKKVEYIKTSQMQ